MAMVPGERLMEALLGSSNKKIKNTENTVNLQIIACVIL